MAARGTRKADLGEGELKRESEESAVVAGGVLDSVVGAVRTELEVVTVAVTTVWGEGIARRSPFVGTLPRRVSLATTPRCLFCASVCGPP